MLDPAKVAAATGCAPAAVAENLPAIVSALASRGADDFATLVAAAATVRVETGNFRPITERGPVSYFTRYDGRKDLGNINPGDGYRFRGRGFVQITGRANYRYYGKLLATPLEQFPDLALNADTAARVLAAYFAARKIPEASRLSDWGKVRRAVNGGINGWEIFAPAVRELLRAFPEYRGDLVEP